MSKDEKKSSPSPNHGLPFDPAHWLGVHSLAAAGLPFPHLTHLSNPYSLLGQPSAFPGLFGGLGAIPNPLHAAALSHSLAAGGTTDWWRPTSEPLPIPASLPLAASSSLAAVTTSASSSSSSLSSSASSSCTSTTTTVTAVTAAAVAVAATTTTSTTTSTSANPAVSTVVIADLSLAATHPLSLNFLVGNLGPGLVGPALGPITSIESPKSSIGLLLASPVDLPKHTSYYGLPKHPSELSSPSPPSSSQSSSAAAGHKGRSSRSTAASSSSTTTTTSSSHRQLSSSRSSPSASSSHSAATISPYLPSWAVNGSAYPFAHPSSSSAEVKQPLSASSRKSRKLPSNNTDSRKSNNSSKIPQAHQHAPTSLLSIPSAHLSSTLLDKSGTSDSFAFDPHSMITPYHMSPELAYLSQSLFLHRPDLGLSSPFLAASAAAAAAAAAAASSASSSLSSSATTSVSTTASVGNERGHTILSLSPLSSSSSSLLTLSSSSKQSAPKPVPSSSMSGRSAEGSRKHKEQKAAEVPKPSSQKPQNGVASPTHDLRSHQKDDLKETFDERFLADLSHPSHFMDDDRKKRLADHIRKRVGMQGGMAALMSEHGVKPSDWLDSPSEGGGVLKVDVEMGKADNQLASSTKQPARAGRESTHTGKRLKDRELPEKIRSEAELEKHEEQVQNLQSLSSKLLDETLESVRSGAHSETDDSKLDNSSASETLDMGSQSGSESERSTPESSKRGADGSTDEGSPNKKRCMQLDERELTIPLEHGWNRQTIINGMGRRGIVGEVLYFAPCGKKMKTIPDVMRYLERNPNSDLGRENFSFNTKVNVGQFYEIRGGQGSAPVPLTDTEILEKIEMSRGKRARMQLLARKKREKAAREHALARQIMENKLKRRMELQEMSRRASELRFEKRLERLKQKEEEKKERENKVIERRKEKEQYKMQKQQEKIRVQEQLRKERELRAQQIIEARNRRQRELEEMRLADAVQRSKEREMKRQQLIIMKEQERERRRQHLLLVKALEQRKKQEEKQHQRRVEMEVAMELKKPIEDMELKNAKPLPVYPRLKSKLAGRPIADCLMVVEFLNNFGTALNLDKSCLPTLESLERGLLNESEEDVEELMSLVMHLLRFALDDVGVPNPKEAMTKLNQKITEMEMTDTTMSEVLRIFVKARGEKEMCEWLLTKPMEALNPTKKAALLAFLCNELLTSKVVTNEIDKHMDAINNLRRDKWIVEGQLRQLRVFQARKFNKIHKSTDRRANASTTASNYTFGDDDTMSSSKLGSDDEDDKDDDEDKEDEEGSDNESDGTSSIMTSTSVNSNAPFEPVDETMTREESDKRIEKLRKQHAAFRQKVFRASLRLRAINVGQDRYKRTYWVLPLTGGVYVEGLESGIPEDFLKEAEVKREQEVGDGVKQEKTALGEEKLPERANEGEERPGTHQQQNSNSENEIKVANLTKKGTENVGEESGDRGSGELVSQQESMYKDNVKIMSQQGSSEDISNQKGAETGHLMSPKVAPGEDSDEGKHLERVKLNHSDISGISCLQASSPNHLGSLVMNSACEQNLKGNKSLLSSTGLSSLAENAFCDVNGAVDETKATTFDDEDDDSWMDTSVEDAEEKEIEKDMRVSPHTQGYSGRGAAGSRKEVGVDDARQVEIDTPSLLQEGQSSNGNNAAHHSPAVVALNGTIATTNTNKPRKLPSEMEQEKVDHFGSNSETTTEPLSFSANSKSSGQGRVEESTAHNLSTSDKDHTIGKSGRVLDSDHTCSDQACGSSAAEDLEQHRLSVAGDKDIKGVKKTDSCTPITSDKTLEYASASLFHLDNTCDQSLTVKNSVSINSSSRTHGKEESKSLHLTNSTKSSERGTGEKFPKLPLILSCEKSNLPASVVSDILRVPKVACGQKETLVSLLNHSIQQAYQSQEPKEVMSGHTLTTRNQASSSSLLASSSSSSSLSPLSSTAVGQKSSAALAAETSSILSSSLLFSAIPKLPQPAHAKKGPAQSTMPSSMPTGSDLGGAAALDFTPKSKLKPSILDTPSPLLQSTPIPAHSKNPQPLPPFHPSAQASLNLDQTPPAAHAGNKMNKLPSLPLHQVGPAPSPHLPQPPYIPGLVHHPYGPCSASETLSSLASIVSPPPAHHHPNSASASSLITPSPIPPHPTLGDLETRSSSFLKVDSILKGESHFSSSELLQQAASHVLRSAENKKLSPVSSSPSSSSSSSIPHQHSRLSASLLSSPSAALTETAATMSTMTNEDFLSRFAGSEHTSKGTGEIVDHKLWFSILPRLPCDEQSLTQPGQSTLPFYQPTSSSSSYSSFSASSSLSAISSYLNSSSVLDSFLPLLHSNPSLLSQDSLLMSLQLLAQPISSSPSPTPCSTPGPDLAPEFKVPPPPDSSGIDPWDMLRAAQGEAKPIPKNLQHGWWRIYDIAQLKSVMPCTLSRGIREKNLQRSIHRYLDYARLHCTYDSDKGEINPDADIAQREEKGEEDKPESGKTGSRKKDEGKKRKEKKDECKKEGAEKSSPGDSTAEEETSKSETPAPPIVKVEVEDAAAEVAAEEGDKKDDKQSCDKPSDIVTATGEGEEDVEDFVPPDDPHSWSIKVMHEIEMAALEEVEALEERIFQASLQTKLGWRPSKDNDPKLVDRSVKEVADHEGYPLDVAISRLLELEANIERRYLKPPLIRSVQLNLSNLSSHSGDGDYGDDEDIPPGLQLWRQAVVAAESPAQLSLCTQLLAKSISWEKSIMRVTCLICRKDDNEAELLLCDGCDKGYHTYCFKPKMENIPEGDWYCFECVSKASGTPHCVVCGRTGGRMVSCRMCPRYTHLECVDPPLPRMPKRWQCLNCLVEKGNSKRSRKRKESLPTVQRITITKLVIKEEPRDEEYMNAEIRALSSTGLDSADGDGETERKSEAGAESRSSSDRSASGGDNAFQAGGDKKKRKRREKEAEVPASAPSPPKKKDRKEKPVKKERKPREKKGSPEVEKRKEGVVEERRSEKGPSKDITACGKLLMELEKHEDGWPFLKPVNKKQFPSYKKYIKFPMDFCTARAKLKAKEYKHRQEFAADMRLIFNNCETFNEDESEVGRAGYTMRQFFERRWLEVFPDDAP